jgi:opacity protein-like surface antigen
VPIAWFFLPPPGREADPIPGGYEHAATMAVDVFGDEDAWQWYLARVMALMGAPGSILHDELLGSGGFPGAAEWAGVDDKREELLRDALKRFTSENSDLVESLLASLAKLAEPEYPADTLSEGSSASGATGAASVSCYRNDWLSPQPRSTVYGRVTHTERTTIVQYWYFYPMNDYFANHEGDWEHINVVLTSDRSGIEEVHYFFHARSANLPQGNNRPEITDGTHPVVYVGGRAYTILDYPIRILAGDRNSGSHGNFPYPGEWEGVAGLGHTESVSGPRGDSTRIVPHSRFQVVLTPEPSRIDYHRNPQILREWAWLLLPVHWGFPSAPSIGSQMRLTDMGNRAPFGPAFNAGWNRTAPGLTYPGYRIRRIPVVRSYLEDLLQPWYYLYIFRHPRYVHDTRGTLKREDLERLGFVPRSGWAERGLGSTIFGASLGYPRGSYADLYRSSTGISLWRNLWAKARFGGIEFVGGYQRFQRTEGAGGSLFVYPFTANFVLRAREGLFRPYAVAGAGPSGWESRIRLPNSDAQLLSSGWGIGWTTGIGVEYYLRQRVALDVAVRYLDTPGPGSAGMGGERLKFLTIWVGHYVRF